MDETMQALINKLNDKQKELIMTKKPDGTVDINLDKIAEANKHATNEEEEEASIELFLRNSLEKDPKWKGLDFSRIEPYKDVLIKICSEIGLKEINNPFLNYLTLFYKTNPNANLDRNNLGDLNNLYASDTITKEELMGLSPDGKTNNTDTNILFKPEIYSNYDVDKMVQYWKWLSEPVNLQRMNWQEIEKLNLSKAIKGTAHLIKKNGGKVDDNGNIQDSNGVVRNVRDALFFVNGQNGKVNTQDTLEKILAAGSVGSQQDINKDKGQIQSQKVNSANVNDYLKQTLVNYGSKFGLSKVELSALFNDALNELGL